MSVQIAGNILVQTNSEPVPISMGGTGKTTAPAAINALLPVQSNQAGKVLVTDGTNVSWSISRASTPGGSDTQIQFNDGGSFNGSANLVINKSTGALTSLSTLSGTGVLISNDIATIRPIKFQTAGSDRWLMQVNNVNEVGSNTGSNFEFIAVADNGASTNQVYTISRMTRIVDFKSTPTINGVAIGTGAGTVISVDGTGTVSGLTLTGSVTTSGSLTLGGTISLLSSDVTSALGFTPYDSANPSNYISGISSGDVTSALGFTPYNSTNPAGYISSITSSNVTYALGYTPVNKAGDTLSGSLTFTAGTVTGLSAPVSGTDAATKNYVDAAISGLSWKTSANVATTSNITLSGTQIIDSILVDVGNRVLVKNQTTTSQNGIYIVETGTWLRASDSSTASQINGEAVYIVGGLVNANTGWTETATVTTVGTDPITYAQFSGAGSYVAGTGLSLTGNTFANTGVLSNVAGTGISVSGATGAVTISVSNIPNTALTNDSFTIGYTNVALGGTTTTLAGLSSVSATSFTGLLLGNASTATTLAVPREINGTSFDGSSDITVSADASTLTGTTLNSNVTASSLTSVGTLTQLDTTGPVTINSVGTINTSLLVTSTTSANQVIDSVATASYKVATYRICATYGTDAQYSEVKMIHNGTNVFIGEIDTIVTGSQLATFTADISNGIMRLLTTPVNAITTFKTVSILIAA